MPIAGVRRFQGFDRPGATRSLLESYKATDFQVDFHQATALRRWFCGGFQSGKTHAGAAEAALFSIYYAPGENGLITVPDYPRAIAAKQRFEAFLPRGSLLSWNGQERAWKIAARGGRVSTVFLRSVRNPEAVAGIPVAWCWMDEPALYDPEAWLQVRPRVAVAKSRGLGFTWATSTPKGRNWLWKEAVDEAGSDDYLVHVESRSNPVFPDSEWDELVERYGFDSPYIRQYYRGLFEAFVGQAIPQFDRRTMTGTFPAVRGWRIFRAWDFGYTAPTVCLWIMLSPSDDVFVLREHRWEQKTRAEILPDLEGGVQVGGILCGPESAEADCIDPSGAVGSKQGHDRGWAHGLERELGVREVRLSRKFSESEGLGMVREWCVRGKLYIDARCPDMIEALETGELDDNPEKDLVREGQHPQADFLDALRYFFVNVLGPQLEAVVRLR